MSVHFHPSDHSSERGLTRLIWAMGITASLMLAEALGGLWSGSLALLADAGHMLFDLLALALAFFTAKRSQQKPDALRTYGYGRIEILGAFFNGITLIWVSAVIIYHAAVRLFYPEPIMTQAMLGLAVVGLVANLAALGLLHGSGSGHVGVRAAALHVAGDALSSVGVIVGALMISATGKVFIDPMLSALIAIVVAITSLKLLRDVSAVLLQTTPVALSFEGAEAMMLNVAGVAKVDHLHLWEVTHGQPIVTAHLKLDAETQDRDAICHKVCEAVRLRLPKAQITLQTNIS